MKHHFDVGSEASLLKRYIDNLPAPLAVKREEEKLRRMCRALHSLFPAESCLEHTCTTAWIPSWALTVSSQNTRVLQILALDRWWSWLFDQKIIDDNVLAHYYPRQQVLCESTPVVLSHNLQRSIAEYLNEHGPRSRDVRSHVQCRLRSFNLFLHRPRLKWDGYNLSEELILEWFRCTCRAGPAAMGLVAGSLSAFLDYLVKRNRLAANPFTDLRLRFGRRRRGDVLAAMLGRSPLVLKPLTPEPPFRSPLAPQLEGFVALKRAMGLRYDATLPGLQRFDRFVAGQPTATDVVSHELIDAWLVSSRHLSSRNQKKQLGLIRQFCLYVARLRPETYIPDLALLPTRTSRFKAYVYSPEEYRGLLKAALALSAPRSRLRPTTFYTVLVLLYATGLRVGEALRLRIADVDLNAATILVRETKFCKSRIVPFAPKLGDAFRAYLKERLTATTGSDSPLFINYAGRPYSVDKFSEVFRTLFPAAGIARVPGKPGPRVYDIRHTFAQMRVLKWYREGADLQAKLPLLATYMGHVDVLSTQVYLSSTAALLQEASGRFERSFGNLVTEPQEVDYGHR